MTVGRGNRYSLPGPSQQESRIPDQEAEEVPAGEGQYRLRSGRFRYRYDTMEREVVLLHRGLRREDTYRLHSQVLKSGPGAPGTCSGSPLQQLENRYQVKLPFQSTHVSNHGVHILLRKTMAEASLIDLNRRHLVTAFCDQLSQFRVRLALHLC